jgi:hypothetical protein
MIKPRSASLGSSFIISGENIMQKINTWNELKTLDVPVNILNQIYQHLVEPFDGVEQDAMDMWQALSVTFIHIEPSDCAALLNSLDDVTTNQLNFILDYPECISKLDDGYYLALAITNDDGSGVYLLFNQSCNYLRLTQLIEIAQD